ncbi:hypothetical protein AVO42_00450 [Thiomicrospira sp. XS5]|uniref:hypothetical protein n=1 Tax=Thiomicrospira sp. XS5 TaxID=1775636 RepID=UPI0007495EAC|nr:hypothetical protein [Thiomicrospira sp. XS5]KUJ73926.1 hypothetical protein AVO42_00450 [Thiomicrospira sp. XS5]
MSETKTIRVTVSLRDKRAKQFFRAGHKFLAGESKELTMPPLTEDELKRLQKEPKLKVEVEEVESMDSKNNLGDQNSNDQDDGDADQADQSDTNKQDSDEGLSLVDAIGQLDPDDDAMWLKVSGKPSTQALEFAIGQPVSADDRDQAWEIYQAQQDSGDVE